jgi:hypothetical protein
MTAITAPTITPVWLEVFEEVDETSQHSQAPSPGQVPGHKQSVQPTQPEVQWYGNSFNEAEHEGSGVGENGVGRVGAGV